jgi:hypothetical protein
MLVSQGNPVTYVANQIGDSVKTTLETYSHLFDEAAHAEKSRAAMDAEWGDLANSWQTRASESSGTEREEGVVNIASVQGKALETAIRRERREGVLPSRQAGGHWFEPTTAH